MTRITGTLREDLRTFTIVSRRILSKMKNDSDKFCGENRRTGQATDDDIIRGMRFTSWITKDTNTGSEYFIHFFSTVKIVKRKLHNVTLYYLLTYLLTYSMEQSPS